MNHLFMSYSRRQFYFTEQLAATLRAAHVNVWFDVENLQTGEDWEAGLRAGLEQCAALLLVASRAALASPYVEAEWRAALEADKPIYIALFEAVDLPPDLRETAAAVIDFRGDYTIGCAKLMSSLDRAPVMREARGFGASDKPVKPVFDRVPRPNRYGLPTRLPPKVLYFTAILMVSALYHMGSAFSIRWPGVFASTLLGIIFFGFGARLLFLAWQFLRRDFRFENLRDSLISLNLIGFITYNTISFSFEQLQVFSSPQEGSSLLVGLAVMGLALYGINLYRTAADIYRWLPTGQAPPEFRARIYPDIFKTPKTTFGERMGKAFRRLNPLTWFRRVPEATPERYPNAAVFDVHYVLQDEKIALKLADTLRAHGHRTAPPGEPVEHHLVIVSGYTDAGWLRKVVNEHPRLIAVIVSSVNVPDDLTALTRYQWIDYRTQSPVQLDALARYLSAIKSADVIHIMNNVPESLSKLVVPPGINTASLTVRGMAAFNIALGLLLALAQVQGLGIQQTNAALGLVAGLVQFWLVSRMLQRKIGMTAFSLALGVTVALQTVAFGLQLARTTQLSVIGGTSFLVLQSLFISLGNARPWFPHGGLFGGRAPLAANHQRQIAAASLLFVASGLWVAVTQANFVGLGTLETTFHYLRGGPSQAFMVERLSFAAPVYWTASTDMSNLNDFARQAQQDFTSVADVRWFGAYTVNFSPQQGVQAVLLRYQPTIAGAPSDPAVAMQNVVNAAIENTRRENSVVYTDQFGRMQMRSYNSLPEIRTEMQLLGIAQVNTQSPEVTATRIDALTTITSRRDFSSLSAHDIIVTLDSPAEDYILYIVGSSEAIRLYQRELNALIASFRWQP